MAAPRRIHRHARGRARAGLLALLLAPRLAGAAGPAPPPAETAPAGVADAGYDMALRAYRGELPPAEWEILSETDAAPSLYGSRKTPVEYGITRLFAALPDDAHAALQRQAYVKWRVDTLPPAQLRWVKAAAKQWEERGAGPFAFRGPDTASTGFARVEIPGAPGPLYSWWLARPGGSRPVWLTVVRALGLGTQPYFDAHREQLPPLLAKPDTQPIPEPRWRKLRETDAEPAGPDPAAEAEKEYWNVVRAYRGDLKREALRAVAAGDDLLARRLESREPADRALNRFFARISDREHRALLETGRLAWRMEQLSADRRKLLEPVLLALSSGPPGSDTGALRYRAEPYSGTVVGVALVRVPGAARQVVTWWVRSLEAPGPAWISLAGGAALKSPAYYRAHLEQLGGP